MRKLVFSALACVAFAGSGFASNKVVVEKQDFESAVEEFAPCRVFFAVYDGSGDVLDYVYHETNTPTLGGCYAYGAQLMLEFEALYPDGRIGDESINYG